MRSRVEFRRFLALAALAVAAAALVSPARVVASHRVAPVQRDTIGVAAAHVQIVGALRAKAGGVSSRALLRVALGLLAMACAITAALGCAWLQLASIAPRWQLRGFAISERGPPALLH